MNFRDLLPAKWMGHDKMVHDRMLHSDEFPYRAWEGSMQRMFDDFFNGFEPEFAEGNGGTSFAAMPRADISETERDIQVTVDLPGVAEQDVDVTLSSGMLTIRGEKKSEHEEQGKNYYRKERSAGSFQRSIPLPAEIDSDKVDATFSKGVLHITLPKTEAALQHKVAVKALN